MFRNTKLDPKTVFSQIYNLTKLEILEFNLNLRQAPWLHVFTPENLTTDEKTNKTVTFCAKSDFYPYVQVLWEGPISTYFQPISSAPLRNRP